VVPHNDGIWGFAKQRPSGHSGRSGYVGVAGSCLGGLRDSQAITTSSSVKVQLLEPRRPQTHRETRTFRHAVIQGKVDAVLAGFEFDGYGKIEGNSNSLGANHVEIDLKLILSVNPNGRWVVEWVGPSNAAPGPQQVPTKAKVTDSR
jgi:hypothetical protein